MSPARSPHSSAHGRTFKGLIALAALAAAVCACPSPALAQPPDHPDILVTATPARVAPERSLSGADVESYGLATVGEVMSEVAAEDGESREEAAYIVNGKRISGLGSVSDLPAEAIQSIEVLPVGTGVKLGASPSQRVYQIRLRRDLDLFAGRAAARASTDGGWSSARGDATWTRIRGEQRFHLTAKVRDDDILLESERDIVQPAGVLPDAGRFRSLAPAARRIDLSAVAADQLTPWLSGALNGRLAFADRRVALGPFIKAGAAPEPLDQRGRTVSASADLTLNAEIGTWQAAFFGNYGYNRVRTATDIPSAGAAAPSLSRVRSSVRTLGAEISAFGPLAKLPAGPLILNLKAGAARDWIDGERRFGNVTLRNSSSLASTNLTAGIEVPIASRRPGALAALGDLSASAEYSLQHMSDFGSFSAWTLSALWRPADWLSLTGSIARSAEAPSIASLDDPIVETPGVRYFDPVRGETVDVTLVTGGTPGLGRRRGETNRIAANVKPFRSLSLRLTAEYFESRTRNHVSELPAGSLSIMQAFPQRFVRDPGGRLTGVDARPVVFAGRTDRQLRTGLILSLPLGKANGAPAGLAQDEEEGEGGASLTRLSRPSAARVRPRLQLSAAHSWLLESRLVIAPGQRAVDLLSRQAVGFGGLGQPRHRFDASLGYAERGLGARLTVQSRGPSFIESSGTTANLLRFEPLNRFDLRAWIQGERLAPKSKLMKGTRFTLALTNLTNVRERVSDRFGVTPLSYQPGYRDPIGRSIELEFRKKF
ncbi:MAG TPA: TonB-dependent receptor [Allosphingosinicella sp.]